MPPGPVSIRLGDGMPVIFHDRYEPRQVFEPEHAEPIELLPGDGADADEDDEPSDDEDAHPNS